MLKLRDSQIAKAQLPSDARAVSAFTLQIADQVAGLAPELPGVLVRLNVRMFLASLEQHGIDILETQIGIATRYFGAGVVMVRDPFAARWRSILISRNMTQEAKVKQISHLLTQAEVALKAV